jgi:hypothetical protein
MSKITDLEAFLDHIFLTCVMPTQGILSGTETKKALVKELFLIINSPHY